LIRAPGRRFAGVDVEVLRAQVFFAAFAAAYIGVLAIELITCLNIHTARRLRCALGIVFPLVLLGAWREVLNRLLPTVGFAGGSTSSSVGSYIGP
jgi:hypothetical protein